MLPRLAALADRAVTRYDVVFVCDIDIPYDDAWDRSGEVSRVAFQRQVIGDLNERKVPYFMLRGSGRADRALRSVLSPFSKYMNVLELFESRA